MSEKLFIQAITKILSGIVLTGALVFLPAGTFRFPNGWLFMAVLFLPMLLAGVVMMIKSPKLLQKRLNMKEKHKEQKMVVLSCACMFVLGFVAAGLTFRFNWRSFHNGAVLAGILIFLAGYIMYAEVLRENKYLSRNIEVQKDQKVIDTGLYSIVRHPMYSATLLLFMSMPIILGSVYSFLIFLAYPFIVAKRIRSEEEFLENELEGYREYKKKVKYRLIPLVW